jgi:hypothetical protein
VERTGEMKRDERIYMRLTMEGLGFIGWIIDHLRAMYFVNFFSVCDPYKECIVGLCS